MQLLLKAKGVSRGSDHSHHRTRQHQNLNFWALIFRSDNQRQNPLDLSHTCKYRKRLMNWINFATLYVERQQVSCEYSTYKVKCSSIREMCPCPRIPKGIPRGVYVSVPSIRRYKLTSLVEEHQNLNFWKSFQKALISDLIINVKCRSLWAMLAGIECAWSAQ